MCYLALADPWGGAALMASEERRVMLLRNWKKWAADAQEVKP